VSDASGFLAALLHADPAFASGASSFSSGLETLVSDGHVRTESDLVAVMVDAASQRWNSFDRVFLVRSFAASSDLGRIAVDEDVERSTLGSDARRASRRAGGALLGTWARLGRTEVTHYRELVHGGAALGHLSVAQGIVFASNGLDLASAENLACWSVLSGFASGAVRLGVVGHRSAQTALIDAQKALAPLLALPVDPLATPMVWTPVIDIAVERHAYADMRLFAS
jgi:urease accessory protein